MKEVLTRRFWKGVKKTFDEAREGPPPKAGDGEVPAESKPDAAPPKSAPPPDEKA